MKDLYRELKPPVWQGDWCKCKGERPIKEYINFKLKMNGNTDYTQVWLSKWCQKCQHRIKTEVFPFTDLSERQKQTAIFLEGYLWGEDSAEDHYLRKKSLWHLSDEILLKKA